MQSIICCSDRSAATAVPSLVARLWIAASAAKAARQGIRV